MRSDVNLIHRAEVTAVTRLTPGMVRIEFGGEGLDGFVSSGVGDEYLRLFLPPSGHDEPNLPVPTTDDDWSFPEGVEQAVARTYTVRAWEPGRLTIDFVVHDGGVAATWALGARPGHIAGVNTPRPLYAAPDDITWQLLVADATGLPAALRLAEQAPDDVQTRLVLEVLAPEDRQHVVPRPNVEVLWTYGGNGHGPSRIEEIIRGTELPQGRGYVWVAGETKSTRGVRKYLRHELHLPSSDFKVMGYWMMNEEKWTERYEALPEDVRERLEMMWEDESRDVEEITDEYEAALESFGL